MISLLRNTIIGRIVGIGVIVGLLIDVETGASDYWLQMVQQFAVDGCLGLAVVVLLGYAGELSFAYGVLFGVAGYVSYYVVKAGGNLWLSYAAGVVACLVVGALIALPALRIRQLQLALATFGAGIAGIEIFGHLSGASGIVGLKQLNFGSAHSVGLIDLKTTALFALAVLALCYVISELAVSGRLGRRWLLVKTGENLASSLGVRVARERMMAFVVSSLLLGIIGAVYPTMLGLLSPSSYQFSTVINVLIIAILGGLLRPGGAVLGALVFDLLGQKLSNGNAGVTQMVYGVLLLALLAVMPRGIVGTAEQAFAAFTNLVRGRQRDTDVEVASPEPHEPLPAALLRMPPAADLGLRGRGLTKRFGGFTAVDKVDFEVARGAITGLIGSNGAGKSTLLDLLTGFKRPDAGEVWQVIDGTEVDLSHLSSAARARHGVRRTFQHPALVPELSIFDNVTVALESTGSGRREARRLAARALELAELAHEGERRPGDVPYGIVKLIDVARLAATTPAVAFFDEPAAGLGAAELPRLAAMLRALAERGTAVVIVEHNLDFISEISDRLYAMDLGRVIGHGPPAEVLASPELARAYSLQSVGGELEVSHDA